MLAENPAKVAQLHHVGSIEVGKRADMLFFTPDYSLVKTIVAGRVVFERNDVQ
jgi:N-acetylglucosamine-6-phosphate deacetylase